MDKGTYILKIEIQKTFKIRVGAIGEINFDKGLYVYIGSAMNSLTKRIKRHLRKKKKIHWHIDYLTSLPYVRIKEVYVFYDKKIEEEISMKFSNFYKSVKGFGASDMKRVGSNLYLVDENVDSFIESLGGVSFEKIFSSNT